MLSQTYRAMYDIPFETFDITGPQMVLTMKLTTFAWNVWDGRRPTEARDGLYCLEAHSHRIQFNT